VVNGVVIVPITMSDKVSFVCFIDKKTVRECYETIQKLNTSFGKKYYLYGRPFDRTGNILEGDI